MIFLLNPLKRELIYRLKWLSFDWSMTTVFALDWNHFAQLID